MKPNSHFKIRKTYEEVADYIKQQILSGAYQPGDRLPSLRELGELLGVGQSTVREAVSALKTMGLVSIRQGEGTFVTPFHPEEVLSAFEPVRPMTEQDIIALLEVRKIIESGTARLAAERRTEDDLKPLEKALEQMRAALVTGVLGEKADWHFHYSIALASHNPILVSVVQSIGETMEKHVKENRLRLFRTPGNPERLLEEHRRIFEAIANQLPEQAEAAMLAHLQGVEQEMMS
ncbi:FadR family transcriptional regulator [Brevibacillus humidisoli]|uniref:FadR/GntR family transcriptional regulator n=1 Tax=Brevibacillus humidisoli TaxID=2895522 RepID=UPI001E3816C9|nr:FadR/GntR family transcriptional regulator [Brevibacillus humidisoli]UFJ40023.1 FadR family transcriptional regulator [Brevibacillus humidisoli]